MGIKVLFIYPNSYGMNMPDEDPNCTLSINNVQNSHNHDHNKDEMR